MNTAIIVSYATTGSAIFGMMAVVFKVVVNATKETTTVKVNMEHITEDVKEIKADVKEIGRAIRNP